MNDHDLVTNSIISNGQNSVTEGFTVTATVSEDLTNPTGGATVYLVQYGVKGARKVSSKTFHTIYDADEWAKRWTRSNSIGSYWAKITEVISEEERKAYKGEVS